MKAAGLYTAVLFSDDYFILFRGASRPSLRARRSFDPKLWEKQESARSCSSPENRRSLAYRKSALLFKRLLFSYTQLRFEYFVKSFFRALPSLCITKFHAAETSLENCEGSVLYVHISFFYSDMCFSSCSFFFVIILHRFFLNLLSFILLFRW